MTLITGNPTATFEKWCICRAALVPESSTRCWRRWTVFRRGSRCLWWGLQTDQVKLLLVYRRNHSTCGILLTAAAVLDIIDPAILRPGRLDKTLYVGLPSLEDRIDILQTITRNCSQPCIQGISLQEIAAMPQCEGFRYDQRPYLNMKSQ